jgi:hypothetical protein
MGRASSGFQAGLVLVALLACKSGVNDESRVKGPAGPQDIGLSSATRDLECDKATGLRIEACRIAKEFAKGTPPPTWSASGREVWFGRTYRSVAGEADSTELYFLQVQPGHPPAIELSAEESKGTLSVEGSSRDLFPETPAEKAEAEGLLAALKSGAPVPSSGALTFLRTATPKNGYRAMASTKGASNLIVARFPVFIRTSGNHLVMVEPHEKGGGWFSELWKLPPG